MARTSIPPKVRWQVLARDGFRCRYCGAQGGDAVLVVDHAYPVSRGGHNHMDNLITACEPCNQGKSDHVNMGLPELQVYVDTAETMIGWLTNAFCEEAAVSWPPSFDTLAYVVALTDSFREAEDVVRCVGGQVREGTLSPDRHSFLRIMRAIEIYVYCVARMPERVDRFWERIEVTLNRDELLSEHEGR